MNVRLLWYGADDRVGEDGNVKYGVVDRGTRLPIAVYFREMNVNGRVHMTRDRTTVLENTKRAATL